MKEVIGAILLVFGMLILGSIIVYGAFLLHWILGIAILSLILIGLGAALVQDN